MCYSNICPIHCSYYSRELLSFSTYRGVVTVRKWLLNKSGIWSSRYGTQLSHLSLQMPICVGSSFASCWTPLLICGLAEDMSIEGSGVVHRIWEWGSSYHFHHLNESFTLAMESLSPLGIHKIKQTVWLHQLCAENQMVINRCWECFLLITYTYSNWSPLAILNWTG